MENEQITISLDAQQDPPGQMVEKKITKSEEVLFSLVGSILAGDGRRHK